MPYPQFDIRRLRLFPLRERKHDLEGDFYVPLQALQPRQELAEAGQRIAASRSFRASGKGAVLFMCGAHVLRSGLQTHLIDLINRGFVDCLAFNGAGAIHDFELALIGATTESVATYIRDGRFGMWEETGRLNEIVSKGWREGLGFGEAVGREIALGSYPYKERSVFAAAWRTGIPATVHVGIGHDIIHAHPNVDAEAVGGASYRDFLTYAHVLEGLEHGVMAVFGSAVMAPEVYLKALSMVRNVAASEGRSIRHFTTLVCDMQPLAGDTRKEPDKSNPAYYFRPWKTILSRTVADGGESFYVQGRHADTLPELWSAVCGPQPSIAEARP